MVHIVRHDTHFSLFLFFQFNELTLIHHDGEIQNFGFVILLLFKFSHLILRKWGNKILTENFGNEKNGKRHQYN